MPSRESAARARTTMARTAADW